MVHSPRSTARALARPLLASVAALAAVVGVVGFTATGASHPTVHRARLAATTAASCPWVGSHQSIARRVAAVIGRMTLADEITLVEGQGSNQPYVFYMAGIPRLCIPPMGLEDGPNGVADKLTGVTQLPAGVDLASSWDRGLATRYGQVVGAESAGKAVSVNLGPTINIDRDPRWGRSFETFTEDPALNAALAVNEIRGVQSQDVMSQVKHYVAYNQETNRNTPQDNVLVSQRALREIYLPAFQAAVQQAGVASVMCAYSTINGSYACQNRHLLTKVLKQDWGFPGFVTSDYGAIHSTTAAAAGTDMEQPENTYFGNALATAVADHAVPRAVLNTMIQRILTEMFRFGFFDHARPGSTTATVTTPAHVALSTRVAEEGTVLLRNRGSVLPLDPAAAGSVAVVGPAASASPVYGGGGSAAVLPSSTVTPLQGITAAARAATTVSYQQGLPTDTSLAAIPAGTGPSPAGLTPAYQPTPFGGSYTGTLTAPETGTYVLAVTNSCGCYTPTTLSVDGTELLSDPGTPPASTYSASIQLRAGATYQVAVSGSSSSLTWATPSELAPGIQAAVTAARNARTAVVVVADDTESEAADRANLALPSAQDELIAAVAAANPRTVVVVDAGAPVAMPWLPQTASVLDAWYPGQTNGTALAATLFGRSNPSGHLPVTFPASLAQVPAAAPSSFPGVNGQVQYAEGLGVGYRWYDARSLTPMFPFGYGMSYTSFRFRHLRVAQRAVAGVATETVTAQVTNTGSRAGADVAQLYLGDPASSREPARQLVGFQRVALAPGASTTVTFPVTPQSRSWWNQAAGTWSQSAGGYRVLVGDSSSLAQLPLRGHFAVASTPGARTVTLAAPARVLRGRSFRVRVTLGKGGTEVLRGVSLGLTVPQGWTAQAVGRTSFPVVRPGYAPVATYVVTAPPWQPVADATVQATALLGAGSGVVRQTGAGIVTR